MIRLNCPACGATLSVLPELAGKQGRCPGCKQSIRIPDDEPEILQSADEPQAPVRRTRRQSDHEPAPDEERSSKGLWFIVGGGGGAAVAGLVVFLLTRGGPEPSKPADNGIAAKGDRKDEKPNPSKRDDEPKRVVLGDKDPPSVVRDPLRRPRYANQAFDAVGLPGDNVFVKDQNGVFVWDRRAGRIVFHLTLPQNARQTTSVLAATTDGRLGLGGCSGGLVMLWDLALGRPQRSFDEHPKEPITSVAFTQDGSRAITCNGDIRKDTGQSRALLWDIA